MQYHQDKSIKTDQPGLFSNNRRKVVKKMSILIKNESNMLLIISFTVVPFSQLSEQKSEKHFSVLYHKMEKTVKLTTQIRSKLTT